jgi:PTH1 family peptidyl-tRNA hydrolase
MAWLQKRPQVSNPQLFYSSGLSKSLLLIGLGNIGKEYNMTRHNIGFYCLDSFIARTDEMSDWVNKKDMKCYLSDGRLGDHKVIAIKPTTFMNLSGESVQAVANFYRVPLESIVVIHDELDIDFGSIRMRKGGSSAGHNGVKNISKLIGEEYNRIRIGIGPKKPDAVKSEDFVLKKFSKSEQEQLGNLSQEVNAIASEYVFGNQSLNETRSFLL